MSIREPFEPESVKDWALIIHAEAMGERVEVYWVDLNAGRIGLRLAHEVRGWRRRDDLLTIAHRIHYSVNEGPPVDCPNCYGRPIGQCPNCGTIGPEATGGMVEPVVIIESEGPELFIPATDPDECPHGYGSHEQCGICEGEEPEPPEEPPPVIEPESHGEPPRSPVEPFESPERIESRREYLASRVRAIIEHSDTARQALARAWPEGVAGLKHTGQSMDDLDRIYDAVVFIEKNHSVPFYPEWIDPSIEESKASHPSNVWAKPSETKSTPEDRENISGLIMAHPRSGLMRRWIGYAINGGIDHSLDTTALAHALFEFGNLNETDWPDDDLTIMLDGSLRALGYSNGCEDLGRFNPEHAPLLMSAAFAITSGNAMLLFDAQTGKPIVRTNVRKS